MLFRDRRDAGRKLLERLPAIDRQETVVIALPRGGVPVADEIASGLGVPLDVILVRKIGAPQQPELAVGAVTDGKTMRVTVNRDIQVQLGLSDEEIEERARRELPEIERRREAYYRGRSPTSLTGKTVIVVDDGVATGATMRSALRLIREERPARLILALPLAPSDTLASLEAEADETVCLETPSPFYAVGAHYLRFDQVADAEVIVIMERARERDNNDGA